MRTVLAILVCMVNASLDARLREIADLKDRESELVEKFKDFEAEYNELRRQKIVIEWIISRHGKPISVAELPPGISIEVLEPYIGVDDLEAELDEVGRRGVVYSSSCDIIEAEINRIRAQSAEIVTNAQTRISKLRSRFINEIGRNIARLAQLNRVKSLMVQKASRFENFVESQRFRKPTTVSVLNEDEIYATVHDGLVQYIWSPNMDGSLCLLDRILKSIPGGCPQEMIEQVYLEVFREQVLKIEAEQKKLQQDNTRRNTWLKQLLEKESFVSSF